MTATAPTRASSAAEGPVVVVTGGTRGLGLAFARALLGHGARVVLSARSRAATTAADLGDGARGIDCDVSVYGDVERVWSDAVAAFGRVDHWINNAGLGGDPVAFADAKPEHIAPVVAANLTGAMNGTRVALAGMKAQGTGHIWNIEGFGSGGQLRQGMAVYGATKRAIRYFTDAVAAEAANGPVRIGTLSPGPVATDMLQMQYDGANEKRRKLYAKIAQTPDEVAAKLVPQLLASQAHNAKLTALGPVGLLLKIATGKDRGLFQRPNADRHGT